MTSLKIPYNKKLKSKRYCLYCDKITSFDYRKNLNHSSCINCDSRYGVNPNNAILIHFQHKVKNLEKEIKKLKNNECNRCN